MTDTLKEQLSACLDGQLPEAELDLLLKRMARERQLCQALGRYSLVSEALRGNGAVRASGGFADRVSAAIAADSAAERSRGATALFGRTPASRWLRPAVGAAIAASVAAVAVFALQPLSPEPETVVLTASPATETNSDSYIVPANTLSNFVPATQLTNYAVAHSEYSSPLGRRTVLSGVLSEEGEADEAAAVDDQPAADAVDLAVGKPGDPTLASPPQP